MINSFKAPANVVCAPIPNGIPTNLHSTPDNGMDCRCYFWGMARCVFYSFYRPSLRSSLTWNVCSFRCKGVTMNDGGFIYLE